MSEEIVRVFERLPALFDASEPLKRRSARARFVLLLEAGAEKRRLRLEPGALSLETADGPMDGWNLALRAEPQAWLDHWATVPRPDAADLFGMARHGRLKIEGDFLPLMQHLQLVKDILALPRPTPGKAMRPDTGPAGKSGPTEPSFDPIIGRYLRLQIGGEPHRLYVEEAGKGIPLLCLHTAGADGRQYRGLMLDPKVTDRFRVIAFDMPWHGKSSPPEGYQDREYKLSTADYVGQILAVCDALELDRPVVLGCSIGGRIVLQLAADHPDRFRGLIGAQGAAWQAPWYDTDWLHRPDVHGGEVCAALISGNTAPGGPPAEMHETLWHYMQGGPGIFKGDLWFYRVDGDLRETIKRIDTARCPLTLMAGEYDFSCRPEDMQATADAIPGCDAIRMEGLGHFPMSENYEQFATYLHPVLERIAAG